MPKDTKKQAILARISSFEDDIVKAHEYLETGAHSDWRGFRPIFKDKLRDGKILPPHKDWVRNVFISGRERALRKAEKLLDSFDLQCSKFSTEDISTDIINASSPKFCAMAQ